MVKDKENLKILLRFFISVVIVGAIIGVVYLIMHLLGIDDLTQEELREYIASFGVWAPIVYIIISFLQVTFIPIPSGVTILAGNYVFGPWVAFICSYIGCVLGSLVAFWLGRAIGRPFVNWVVGSEAKVDLWIKRLKGREKVLLFFMFLLPFFPDDVLCSIAGIMPISWFGFTIIQLLTRCTSVACTIIFMSGEIIPYEGWGLVVIITACLICMVAFLLSLKYSEKINAYVDNFAKKHFKRRKMMIKNKKGIVNLIVVRHGESEANKLGLFLGQGNMDLTERGHDQAEVTAKFLSTVNIDAIYSSDLTRAYQTAEHTAQEKGLEINTSKGLREIDAGEWDFKPWSELPKLFPDDYKLWQESIGEATCTGGESFQAMRERIIKEMTRIANQSDGMTVAVFSHATIILAFLVEIKGVPAKRVKDYDYASNASVSHFIYKKGKFILKEYSRDDFLGELVTSLPKDEV